MTTIPLTEQQLDDIETRANAATDGPWGVYQYGGDSLIEIAADLEDTGTGYRARRTICRFDEEPMDNDPAHRDWSGEEDWEQVQADAEFVAAMSPEVARALVAEVRRLRAEAAASRPAADDTLPAWLYSRFNDRLDAPAWDRLSDDDRAYWEHQAAAVRRAVARGGFKAARPAVAAVVETGE